jgi:hypothetical protein
MKQIIRGTVLAAVATALMAVPAAADPPDDRPMNHGQCVSSSEQPDGEGGRSEVARGNEQCPKPGGEPEPEPDPEPLVCTENGNVDLDSAANTVTISSGVPEGSSLECETTIEVVEGDTLTFTYSLEGATCGGGVPRLFIEMDDGTFHNTFDDYGPNPLEGACGEGAVGEATEGTVTYTIVDPGTVTAVGFVYDVGTGSVTYSGAELAGETLDI